MGNFLTQEYLIKYVSEILGVSSETVRTADKEKLKKALMMSEKLEDGLVIEQCLDGPGYSIFKYY